MVTKAWGSHGNHIKISSSHAVYSHQRTHGWPCWDVEEVESYTPVLDCKQLFPHHAETAEHMQGRGGILTDYITRINTVTNNLITLAPSMLTIQNIINEIGIHAVITRLDHVEYSTFTSSIFLLSTLDHAAITMAFWNEDLKHQASSASSVISKKKSNTMACTVCKRKGHTLDRCWVTHPELWPALRGEENRRGNIANQVKEHVQNEVMQEFAGNGSLWPSCYKVDCLAFFLIFFLIFLIHPEPFYPFATYLSHLCHHWNRIPFIPTFHKLLPLFTPILLHISRYNLVTTKFKQF